MLVASGRYAESRGDLGPALAAYLEVIRLGAGLETDRTLIGLMIGTAMRRMGLDPLRQLARRVDRPEVLLLIVNDLEQIAARAIPMQEAFKTELLACHGTFELMYRGLAPRPEASNPHHWDEMVVRINQSKGSGLMRWYLGKDRAFLPVFEGWQSLIQDAALPYYELPSRGRYREPARGLLASLVNPIGMLFARVALPNVRRGIDSHALTDAYERATRLTLLLQAYKLRHGELPDRLEALRELAETHRLSDPFSGQTFRYRRQAGGYVLYSVGPDLADDGGTNDYEQRAGSGVRQLEETDLVFSVARAK